MKSLNSKTCFKCNKSKAVKEFHTDKQKKDGLTSRCKSCRKLDRKAFYLKNILHELKRNKKWYIKNKAHHNLLMREHYKKNKKYYRAKRMKYLTSRMQRTPIWADVDGILFFYACCPEGYEVDHIIPLQGKNVSGLHVLENLQYLTPQENYSKGNKFYV